MNLADDFLRATELAEKIGVTPNTLLLWRRKGIGPKYSRVGGRILYRRAAVEDWLASLERDPGGDQ